MVEGEEVTEEGSSTNSRKSTSTISEDFTSKVIGDFGPWQLRISIMMALLKFPLAWYQLGIVFLAPQQDFWCKKPESCSQYSDEEWKVICKPRTEEHPCLIYDPEMLSSSVHIDRRFIPLVYCKQFEFDNSTFRSTIISEWNLVCNRSCLVQLSQVVLMWGILVGNVIFGLAADKYGRKNPLIIAIMMQSACSLLSSLSPWYWLFTILRFCMALACGGIAIISFVICMEIVSGNYRTIIPIVYQIPFGCGNTIMAVLAYYLRHWRKLEFALGSISALYAFYYFYIPESPRWLLAKGRRDQAIEILKQAAAKNHRDVDISDETMSLLKSGRPSNENIGFIGLLKYKNMRLKTVLLSLNWLLTGMNFYAFSQYMGGISNDIFLTVALGGLISTPGSFVCIYIVKYQGRKMAVAGSQIFTGLCFLMLLAVPKEVFENDYPRIIISGLGLAGMAISVPALYLFTGEIYPTLSRNIGVGGCSMFARIGSMLSPVLILLQHISEPLPLLTLAAFCMLQAAMVLPLPETKGCALPDTIEQAERFDRQFSINYRREKKRKHMMRRARSNSPEN